MSREELTRNYPILARHWPDFPPPENSLRTFLEDRVVDFSSIDRRALTDLGGDKFPPAPLHEVSA